MINKERKEEYFKTIKLNNTIRSMFNRAGIIEDVFNKDLCLFKQSEVDDMYSYLAYKTETKYLQVNREYKLYTEWCMNNGFCKVNPYSLYTFKDFGQFINREAQAERFVTRDKFINSIKELQNPRDQFILLALFEFGKSPNYVNIINFNTRYINYELGTVILPTEHEVKISKELMNYAIQARDENYYYKIGSDAVSELKPVSDGDVFKLIKNGKEIMDGKGAVKRMAKIIKRSIQYVDLNDEISGTTLMESGIFEFIRKRCAELNMGYREYIYSDLYSEIKTQYPFFNTRATTFWNDFKSYI